MKWQVGCGCLGPWALPQQWDAEDVGRGLLTGGPARGPWSAQHRGSSGGPEMQVHTPVLMGFLHPLSDSDWEKLRTVAASSCLPGCSLCPPGGGPMGRAGQPGCRGGGWRGGPGVHSSSHALPAVCASAENLDQTREEKEKSPPEPHTPPSTPVKLEEGEHWLGVGRRPPLGGGCTVAQGALAGRGQVS